MEFVSICNGWKVGERRQRWETKYPLKACGEEEYIYISNLNLFPHFLPLSMVWAVCLCALVSEFCVWSESGSVMSVC